MNKISEQKVMIIGGCGFIGHNMALELNKLGAEVTLVDSLQVNNLYSFGNSAKEIPHKDLYLSILNNRINLIRENNINFVMQDARDYHAICRIVTEVKPDVVIQLAAVSHANKSNKDPYSTFDHSLRTLENALDACRDNIKHFIFFSSSMVYGHFAEKAVTEESICNPIGIYGALKFAGEKMVIAYNQVFDLPYTIIRPSALYGERCVSRRVGQIFLENAAQGKDITVHGDGTDALDFTYIQDLIHGVVRTIEHPNSRNQIFNMTYGQGREIREMATMVQEAFPGIEVHYTPKDSLTPDRGTLCIDKAKEMIGYNPQYPIERGYLEYINWYKDFIAHNK